MAVVNFSLDTNTKQVALTINGIIVSATDIMMEKYVFDGEEVLRFHYTIENVDANGMLERRQFYLPSPEELASVSHSGLNKDGFASRILHNDEKAKADIINFLQQGRNIKSSSSE